VQQNFHKLTKKHPVNIGIYE